MNSIPFLVAQATLVFLAAVLVVESFVRRRRASRESEQNRQKQQQIAALTQELLAQKTRLARKEEIADRIPLIVKTITEKLPSGSLPAIAVRFTKEFFHASRVGFFVPVKDSSDFTLLVGFGFPEDWQGKVRFPADEGILGVALQKKVVVAGFESSSSGRRSSRPSLEQSGVMPDFVAPVFGIRGISGVLVVAGCPFPLEEEKKYVSMFTDLLSTSLQKDLLIESGKSSVWVDHLTGVSNRLYFLQRFESEIRRTENYKQPLALFLFDIDEFKKINDVHGHAAGDVAIRKVAEIVRANTRSSDLVGRYGGDEFVVLITATTGEQAFTYAENLRKRIGETEIRFPGHDAPIRITISGGLAIFPTHGLSTSELLLAADNALYEAKHQGRNRTALAQSTGLDGAAV